MNELLKLDGIVADGDVKLQVKRVQKCVETLDVLKIKNSGQSGSDGTEIRDTIQQQQNKPELLVEKPEQRYPNGQIPFRLQPQSRPGSCSSGLVSIVPASPRLKRVMVMTCPFAQLRPTQVFPSGGQGNVSGIQESRAPLLVMDALNCRSASALVIE